MESDVSERPLATSARLAALEKQVAQMQLDLSTMHTNADAAARAAQETHDMVKTLSDALLKPQPGHDKGLLDRVAAVTIRVERGEWSLRVLAWGAGLIVAIGGAATALTKWGA